MKQEELSDKLETLLENLRTANTEKNSEHVESLNKLWEEASEEMLSNAKKEGFFSTKKD